MKREQIIGAMAAALVFAAAAVVSYLLLHHEAANTSVTISGAPDVPTQTLPAPTITPTPVARAAASFPITITDGVGRQVTIKALPQRLVSVGPGLTEWVYALGRGQAVAGVGANDDYPPEAQNIGAVGDERNPDANKIAALMPDLVLMSDSAAARQAADTLTGKGIATLLFAPSDIAGAISEGQTLGRALGVSATAADLTKAMQAKLDAVRQATPRPNRPVVFYEVDASNLDAPLTVAPNSFVGSIILSAGGNNYAIPAPPAAATAGSDNLDAGLVPTYSSGSLVAVNLSDLLQRQPDLIILGDSSVGVTTDEVKARQGWQQLTAVQQSRIFMLDTSLLQPGPRCADGLTQLAQLIRYYDR